MSDVLIGPPTAIKILADRAYLVRANGQFDAENAAAAVPSPCVNVCKMDTERRYCLGCFRTLDELRAWKTLDNPAKRTVWQLIEERMPSLEAALS
jgi:uncharacterized protein